MTALGGREGCMTGPIVDLTRQLEHATSMFQDTEILRLAFEFGQQLGNLYRLSKNIGSPRTSLISWSVVHGIGTCYAGWTRQEASIAGTLGAVLPGIG